MSLKGEAGWQPCTDGELSATIQRVRGKRRQAHRFRLAASVGVGTFLVLVASTYFYTPKTFQEECRQISGLLVKYAAGDLDPRSSRRVEEHLARCGKCQQKLEQIRALNMASTSRTNSDPLALLDYALPRFAIAQLRIRWRPSQPSSPQTPRSQPWRS